MFQACMCSSRASVRFLTYNSRGMGRTGAVVQGAEQIIGSGSRYTMHQAQVLADSVRRDIRQHGAAVLDGYKGE